MTIAYLLMTIAYLLLIISITRQVVLSLFINFHE